MFLLDSWTIITEKELFVGLGWDVPKKEKLEADATVLALDFELNPITNVYYFNLSAFDGSLVHFGDKVSTSDKQLIHIFLNKIPENVHYLTVILLSDEDNSKLKFKKVKAKSLKEHLVEDGIIEKASVEAVLTYGVSQGVIATFTKLEDDIFEVTFDASENYGLFDEPEATAKTIIIDLLNKTSTAYNYVDTTFVAEEDGFVTVQVVIDVNSDLIDSL